MNQFEQHKGRSLRRYCWEIKDSPHNYAKSVENTPSAHPSGSTPSTPSGAERYQYGTISRCGDHRCINNLPPEVKECARAFSSVYISLTGKKFLFSQCHWEGGEVEALCEMTQKVFFSKLQDQECNGKMIQGDNVSKHRDVKYTLQMQWYCVVFYTIKL